MKLDDLSSKEQVFYDFFVWLFDDKRITDKNIDLEKEIDIYETVYNICKKRIFTYIPRFANYAYPAWYACSADAPFRFCHNHRGEKH